MKFQKLIFKLKWITEAVTAVLYVVLKYSRVILKYWMIIEKKMKIRFQTLKAEIKIPKNLNSEKNRKIFFWHFERCSTFFWIWKKYFVQRLSIRWHTKGLVNIYGNTGPGNERSMSQKFVVAPLKCPWQKAGDLVSETSKIRHGPVE